MSTQVSIIIISIDDTLMWCEERVYPEKVVRVVYDSYTHATEEPFWVVSERTYLR